MRRIESRNSGSVRTMVPLCGSNRRRPPIPQNDSTSRIRTRSSTAAASIPPAAADDDRPRVRVHSGLNATTTTTHHRMDYVRGWAWQTLLLHERLRRKRQNSNDSTVVPDDAVLLLEHEPVYTLGRGADAQHVRRLANDTDERKLSRTHRGPGSARLTADRALLDRILMEAQEQEQCHGGAAASAATIRQPLVDRLVQSTLQTVSPACADNGAPVYRVERGGEVTFHGPGQLVVYPMFDLQQPSSSSNLLPRMDLHGFLRQTEQVILDTCADLGLLAQRCPQNQHTGVWIVDNNNNSPRKIAAVGVTASRWITTHGFAINVGNNNDSQDDPLLSYFDAILPCGLADAPLVTSLAAEGVTTTVSQVAERVRHNMERVFGVTLVEGEPLR